LGLLVQEVRARSLWTEAWWIARTRRMCNEAYQCWNCWCRSVCDDAMMRWWDCQNRKNVQWSISMLAC